MNRFVFVGALAFAVPAFACKNPQYPTSADYQCLADDVLINNVTDPAQVLKDCPGFVNVALSDLDQLIQGLIGTSEDMQTPANVMKRAKAAK